MDNNPNMQHRIHFIAWTFLVISIVFNLFFLDRIEHYQNENERLASDPTAGGNHFYFSIHITGVDSVTGEAITLLDFRGAGGNGEGRVSRAFDSDGTLVLYGYFHGYSSDSSYLRASVGSDGYETQEFEITPHSPDQMTVELTEKTSE